MFSSNLENDPAFSAFVVHQMDLDNLVDKIADAEDIDIDYEVTPSDKEYIKNRLYNKYNIIFN